MTEGKPNLISDVVSALVGAGENPESFKPTVNYQLTNFVEWIIACKRCGRPLTGLSPKNGWCMCSTSGEAKPVAKEEKSPAPTAAPDEVAVLRTRAETAESEVAKLKDKLDKASKKISELMKGKKE